MKLRRRRSDGIGDHPGAMIFGALLGAAAAGVATLFYTPWSGEQLRERLFGPVMETGGNVAGTVSTAAAPVVATVGDVAHKGKEMVAPAAEKVGEVARKGVEAGSGAVQSVTGQVHSLTGRSGSETEETLVVTPEHVATEKPLQTL